MRTVEKVQGHEVVTKTVEMTQNGTLMLVQSVSEMDRPGHVNSNAVILAPKDVPMLIESLQNYSKRHPAK